MAVLASVLTGVERHIAAAHAMLLRGQRPTVDLLVAECGGSRTTAQKALTDLWESRLPQLLAARQYEDDVPVPVREAVGAVWREARTEAEAVAQAKLAEQMQSLDAERARVSGVMLGIEAERKEAADTLAAQQAALADMRTMLDAAQDRASTLNDALVNARADLSDCRALIERKADEILSLRAAVDEGKAALAAQDAAHRQATAEAGALHAQAMESARTAADAERAALIAAHAQAMDALKAAYVESEARLRVEIDALKTDAAKRQREAERATQTAQGRIAELTERLLAAERARRQRPWRKGSLLRRPKGGA